MDNIYHKNNSNHSETTTADISTISTDENNIVENECEKITDDQNDSSDKKFHVHLISDATGETIGAILRACMTQFENIEITEHVYAFIKTRAQMQLVVDAIKKYPSIVLYTILNKEVLQVLKTECKKLDVICIPVLESIITTLSDMFGQEVTSMGRTQYFDKKYVARMEAINYTIAHDDGQCIETLYQADMILIGLSRTSKSPVSVYLANRGFKVANVPYVSQSTFPDLTKLKTVLVVGFVIKPEVLVDIRKNRLISMGHNNVNDSYTNLIDVDSEIKDVKAICRKNRWKIIDVTEKSVEEISTSIIRFYDIQQTLWKKK